MDKETEDKLEKQIDKILKLTKIEIAQGITRLVVRSSVATITVLIVKNLVPADDLSKKEKLQLYVGAWAIGGLAADRAANWASHRVGSNLTLIQNSVNEIKIAWKEAPDYQPKKETEEA